MKPLKDSNGWCCAASMTYDEHVEISGHCCQKMNTPIEKLPWWAQFMARIRSFWHQVLE